MPLWFSKLIEYWKPEQPPPTTPMRRPAGTGSCVDMISRTFATAAGVRVTGVVLLGAPVTTSAVGVGVTVGVDMGYLLVYFVTIKCMRPISQPQAVKWQRSALTIGARAPS